MSVRVMGMVFDAGPEKPADRLMLLAIADHADDLGVAWPGMERLAHKCCVEVRAAQYTIRRLEEEGWITTLPGGGTRGRQGIGIPNRYQIAVERLQPTVQPTAPLPPSKGAVHDGARVQPTAPEPSLEPPTTPSTGSSTSLGSNAEVVASGGYCAPVQRRGRMTDSWNPTPLILATAHDAYPRVNVKREVVTFRAWHQSKAPTERSRSEWDHLFVTWCGRKQEQWDQANPPDDQGVRYDDTTGMPVNPKQGPNPRPDERE